VAKTGSKEKLPPPVGAPFCFMPGYERFSLGDSRTLRGWNKYDIAPAGGDRMFHASLEYRYDLLALFLDSGSVWNDGTARQARFSTGVTYQPGPLFFTLGFPLNTDELRAVFTMGFRISSFGWKRD
jgi:outer membrane protein assembly factor BamA